MKKINELKSERADLISKMEVITKNTELTDALRSEYDGFEAQITVVDGDIKRAEKQESLNKIIASQTIEETPAERTEAARYVDALRGFFANEDISDEFRGADGGLLFRDDLLTTTDAGLVIKDVEKSLNIAKSKVLLDKLPVKRFKGMKGQFDLTAMAEVTASFVGETVAVPDASANPQTPVTLAPRRLGAYQVISKEALNSTNPNVWADIVQDISDAWDRKVSSDAITQLVADAASAATTIGGANFAFSDALQLQANVPYDMTSPVYLTTPTNAAKLASTVSLTAVEGPIWKGNIFEGTMAGMPAFANTSVPADHLIFVDATKLSVAEFGPKEIIYNPYEFDTEGKIKVTISGMVDTGFGNYRFASFFADASIA